MKDFVKKIKQEDARIEMRKKQLIKQAERIAAARAKAAALKDGAAAPGLPATANTVQNSTSATTIATAGSQESLSPSKANPPSSTPVPLHPSLPAKPGTTPVPESAAASPARVSTPIPPPAASSTSTSAPVTPTPAPEPAPIVLPPDDQLAKYEEVCVPTFVAVLRFPRRHF